MEISDAAHRAKYEGVDNFRISAAFLPDNASYHAAHHERASSLAKAAALLSDANFTVFNLYGDRVDDLEQGSPDYDTCVYQHLTTYIGGDLNVYRCCNTSYNPLGLLGSIKEKRFKDFWVDEAAKGMFGFNAHDCPRCQFHRPNRLGNYMLEKTPEHVNFV